MTSDSELQNGEDSMKEQTMNDQKLSGKRIAFLATDGFEQVELTAPWKAIHAAGAEVVLVSPKHGEIQGMNHDEKADTFKVDQDVASASAEDFDGLVLPGGVANPDSLRTCDTSVSFVRDFFKQHKPVAAICHGPWTLIEADVVRGRRMTSWPSLKTDLKNAGAQWCDEACVCDEGLVTSRNPDDLPAFCDKAIEEFAEGKHAEQTV
ncbi:putative cysteine protease YraA [Novipirellula galeiformis]|uniref:Putative cysteine protease YraA n=2 Tax=Novipirellula galeiformis TaxID=2528004 RepID=A0A5C6CDW3_9BACT|nr:putative cysteine protease YraA [Novipirellula galeiformis]